MTLLALWTLALASCFNDVAGTVVGDSYTFPETSSIAGTIKSQVYDDAGKSIASVDTWFLEGYEKVPFLRLSDVADIISKLNDRGWHLDDEKDSAGLWYYKSYGYNPHPDAPYKDDSLTFDPENQTISSDEFIRVLSYPSFITENGIGYSFFPKVASASNQSPAITLDNASQVKPKEKTVIKLGDYGMKMFVFDTTIFNSKNFLNYNENNKFEGYKNDLLIPFQALSSAFFFFSIATFNGRDYYIWLDPANNSNTASRAYDAGRESRSTRSQFMAEWNYRNLCMFFDLNYSLKTKRDLVNKDNIGPRINDSIFAHGYGFGLLSTDTAVYDTALAKFLMTYIDDGHTSYSEPSLYQPQSAVYDYKVLAYRSSGPRNAALDRTLDDLTERRKDAGGGEGVFYVKDENDDKKMAVIVFDGFVGADPGAGPWTETDLPKLAETNTYQFFKQAFAGIATSGVKNVVIDLSCNGGGACNQAFLALCFLEDPDKFYMGQWNVLDNSMTKFTASINDGTSTSLKKDKNFFVLTSEFSFSCGNYFPAVCKYQFHKDSIFVRNVGRQSGGGAANVKSAQTADGALFKTSCATQMCEFDANGNYICIDAGVPVDYEIE
ncbi:MAG: hypothetical protein J5700_06845, partial [Treponema sp.]|nr:hypothetical protein [Treponema sp.]